MSKSLPDTISGMLDAQALVARLVGVGYDVPAISAVTGFSEHDLRTTFAHQVENGASIALAELMDLTFRRAHAGDMQALKLMHKLIAPASGRERALAFAKMVDVAEPTPAPPTEEKVGRKQQRMNDAAVAGEGTEWGDDLASRVVQ